MSVLDKNPYEVVPYKIQKKSLKILSDYYFNNDKFILPSTIASKMQRERRSFDFLVKPRTLKFII